MHLPRLVFLIAATAVFIMTGSHGALAVETVKIKDGDKVRTVVAEILIESQDGGLMLQGDDGHIWTLQANQILDRKSDNLPLQPITAVQMEQRMLAELPTGFKAHRTPHYLIVYNCNDMYARQVGILFEQLYRGFFTYWKNQHWKLPKPAFPLVAVVLKDHANFLKYAKADIGDTAKAVIGYYHLASNRMVTFNVPNFERNVSTIIHEGTHQLAYNCGLQRRFADNPMWVSEGLAMFFESPDRRNPLKWRSIGQLNQVNLKRWYAYLPKRPENSLATLLADDKRFRDPRTAEAAYGESWALTYFLIKTNRRKQYVEYLQKLSEGKPLVELAPRQRVAMFERIFKTKLADLDAAFLKYMQSVR